MKAPRSIRFKLVTLYVMLLVAVFLCFGFYTYWGFRQFLVRSLEQTLQRRADQIARTILDDLPTRGEAYVASEIQARYAPELNERVIRITVNGGRQIYASKNAGFLSVDAPTSAAENTRLDKPWYEEKLAAGGRRFLVVNLRHSLPNGGVGLVQVGAPEAGIFNELDDLVLTLAIGFPVLLGLAILGGYSLLGRALRPVDEIVGAAERITFKNINQRLPVPPTGDEFERISEALNRMIARLDETFQIANRFSADASHELRTPLTVIQGELEVFVKDPALPPEAMERAGSILEEVVRLSRIVEGLLLVSRLEAGEVQMRVKAIDLGETVASVAEQMEPLWRDKLITLTQSLAPQVIVEGDELRLQQVIVNLIDNAIKYTPEGGEIDLQVRSTDNEACFQVSDNGMGISTAALPQVFDRFFRAEEAKAGRTQGTGLGLAIVQSITEAHRGRITVESREFLGSKFRIILPLLTKSPGTSREGRKVAV